jgi:hypothetical protein
MMDLAKASWSSPGRELGRFHQLRRDLYWAVANLIQTPPTARSLAAIRDAIEDRGSSPSAYATAELSARLGTITEEEALAEYRRLFSKDGGEVELRCAQPAQPIRRVAAAAAQIEPLDDRAVEIRVLAILADRTARAMADADLPEAAALCALQERYLSQDAGQCLFGFASELEQHGGPLYAAAGRALCRQIEEDLRLLSHPASR